VTRLIPGSLAPSVRAVKDLRRVSLALVAAALVLASGCSAGTKAGGPAHEHAIVLTIANRQGEGQDLNEYVAAVDRLSGGSLRLEVRGHWREHQARADPRTLRDVGAGTIDLGKVAVGALGLVGDHRFDALVAPFLVDSLSLEHKVLAGRVADEMLSSGKRRNAVVVALLPGPLQRPFGQRRRLLSLPDYKGALFAIGPSSVAQATFEALGAKPHAVSELPYAFAGGELDVKTIADANYDTKVTSLTSNVVFWPRPFAVAANARVLARLTRNEQDVLRRAGRQALAAAIERLRTEEADSAGTLCNRGQLSLVRSPPSGLAGLRTAVRPVYRTLERNPETRAAIGTIEALKRRSPPSPQMACPLPTSGQVASTPLQGTWEMSAPKRYGIDAGRYRLVFAHGRYVLTHLSPPRWGGPPAGSFRVEGHLVQLRDPSGEEGVYRWNVYRGTLTLRYTDKEIGAPNPTFGTWYRR
jgi:TRAP-type C4-dicarboxylate transport system substrate-binding protein